VDNEPHISPTHPQVSTLREVHITNSSLGAKSINVTSEFESIIQSNGQNIEMYLFAVISVHENSQGTYAVHETSIVCFIEGGEQFE
jgi:hypothetical protein